MAKKKVAILGGGMAALAAAFELTSRPGWEQEFEVTVYQVGWRLGGKCATSRNPAVRGRIEEHGIHYLLGFYENAFHLIRRLYAEYLPHFPSPFKTWRDAFRQSSTITSMELDREQWTPFGASWLRNSDLPGDDILFTGTATEPTLWQLLKRLLRLSRLEVRQLEADSSAHFSPTMLAGVHGVAGSFVKASALAERHADAPPPESADLDQIDLLMQDCSAMLTVQTELGFAPPKARHALIFLEVAAAIVRGMIADRVIHRGYQSIDGREFIEWLRAHGCRHTDFGAIRGGYDACFAYLDGDPKHPSMSAAVALHGALRLWTTYKGSLFWPMESGMAEVIFTPMFHVLSRRGVRFEFFHRVSHLGLSSDQRHVQRIEMDVQARLTHPDAGYQPFITVKGMDCWPDVPLYDQLENPDALKGFDMESAWAAPSPVGKTTLIRGTDFDDVIFGISLGAVPLLCSELINARTQWANMVKQMPTVQTQALQLWLKASSPQLGYDTGTVFPTADRPCLSGFVKPFDTYVDMTELKDREAWEPADGVAHLAYFCTTLPEAKPVPAPGTDPGFPAREHARVRANALEFITKHLPVIWPTSTKGVGSFNWRLLADPDDRVGEERLDGQYWRANIDPSARYVLSPPGTMSHRLHPDQSGFENLYLAGDWTFSGMNSGCVEGATMSGLKAAGGVARRAVPIYGWP